MNAKTVPFGFRFAKGIAALAIALAAACVLALFAHVGQANAKPYGPIEYTIKTDHVVITGYNDNSATVVTIPEEIEGYPVTAIQYGALRQNSKWTKVTVKAKVKAIPDVCFYKCPNLEEVTLPDTVESIGEVAFYGCTNLKTVSLGGSLTEIDKEAFFGCTSLEAITLPSSLVSLGEQAFYGCKALKSVEVPEGVKTIQESAFKNCKALSSVTLNVGLETIGPHAFDTCEALTNLAIPDSVTEIGENAFRYSGLVKTNLPSGLLTLGEEAFSYCGKLSDVGPIPASLVNIGAYAFSNCAFEYIALPNTIDTIPEGMFFACSKMKSIALPDTLKSIGKYAFASCKALEYLRVPKSVTSIGNYAFQKLQGAKMVYFENGDKNWTGALVFGESDWYKDKSLTIVCAAGTANDACKKEAATIGASFKTLSETGSFTVKHDENGGSGTMADVTLPKGFAYALPLCAFTKSAADFKEWEAPDGTKRQPGQAMPADGSASMTAKALWDDWADSGYTVTFKANGGTGDDIAMTVKKDAAFTAPICTFTPPEGKTFAYWSYRLGGTDYILNEGGVRYPGAVYSLTVKAQWVGQYAITFNANGGTVSQSSMKTNGSGQLESWPSATRPGYILDCWSLGDDYAEQVSLGRAYTADTTLNAIWEPVSSTSAGGYLIMFDANGGTVPAGQESAFTDGSGKLSSLPTPTWEGSTFTGWFRSDMTTQVTTSTVFSANEKVYAKWEEGSGESGGSSSGGSGGSGGSGELTPGVVDDGSGDSLTPTAVVDMRRLYNPYSYEHFYTADEAERANLVSLGWVDEGVGWTAPVTSSIPVYRLYNPNNGGDHHYTKDASERDALVAAGWVDEDVGWYSAADDGVPVYREYNPNELVRNHNYTKDKDEHDGLVAIGWYDEDIAWYGV